MSPAAPAPPAIEARGLSKRFGAVTALDRLDLEVASGQSVAVFGPNGAGKTTLIRILTLGLRAASGTFRVSGLDPAADDLRIRQCIGLISHQSLLYDALTAVENLAFFARLYGVEQPRTRATQLLQTVGLGHRANDPVGGLSRGMQQRVSIARALVHDPAVVLLDEPFSGLDPHAAEMLRTTLDSLRTRGRTVLLVTHDLRQGLQLSDRFVLLSRGRVLATGDSAAVDPESFERDYFRRLAEDGMGPTDMKQPGFFRASAIIAAKDLRLEWRTLETLSSTAVFSLTVLVVFNFAFGVGAIHELGVARLVPGVLWTVLAFAAVVALARSIQLERAHDTSRALLLAPVDRGALYVGKMLANLVKLTALEAFLLPLTAVFFDYDLFAVLAPLGFVVLLHGLGLTELGTLFAAVSTRLGRGEALLATLLFPAASPLLISAVKCSAACLSGAGLSSVSNWLLVAVGFDVLYFFVALLTFEFVMEE